MASLSALPGEILDAIFAHLPQASLLAMTRSDKKMSCVAVPHLYRSIYFWGTGYVDREKRRFPGSYLKKIFTDLPPPSNATRIFDVELLMRTLETDDIWFRSSIQKLDLTWGESDEISNHSAVRRHLLSKGTFENDNPFMNLAAENADLLEEEISQLLVVEEEQRLSHFLSLLDCTALKSIAMTTTDVNTALPKAVNVKSLQLKYYCSEPEDDIRLTEELGQLYQHSCIPSLEALIIDVWSDWDEFSCYCMPSEREQARVSSISRLVIRQDSPSIDLCSILKWPRALKVFHFDYCAREGTAMDLHMLSRNRLFRYLKYCSKTLEELSIRWIEDIDADDDRDADLLDLHQFKNLKRLRIRYDHLYMSECERSRGHRSINGDTAIHKPDLKDFLPPSLEQLHLELEAIYDLGSGPHSNYEALDNRYDFFELMDQLQALAASKTRDFPHLKVVAFGEARNLKTVTHLVFADTDEGARVRGSFAEVGVEFTYWEGGSESVWEFIS